jgi:hypothetical protein
MNREQVQQLVVDVIARLAPRLGADGLRGRLVVAFSGATVSLPEALRQCRSLVLGGYQLRLAFSPTAEQFFGSVVRESLDGFPHVDRIDPPQWLGELAESRAVLCPMLSANTLSKLSLLIADGLVPNLLLHGLYMGKPVVLARDGVDTDGEGRRSLNFHNGTPALRRALDDRLHTVADYGCRIADAHHLHATVDAVLASGGPPPPAGEPGNAGARPPAAAGLRAGPVVTAADVRRAHQAGGALGLSPGSLVTPLARDLATQLGVQLTGNGRELQ